ncbi:MAG TPA: hypothetical protein VF161_02885 [Steroidobacteraceae bacterium]
MRVLAASAWLWSFVLLVGCEQRPPMVYVLESPQTVTLTPSVSATEAKLGETVVLRVERRTSGNWRQVPRSEVQPGQCWMYRPPPEVEAEVADDVYWEVVPEEAIRLNTEFRLDHTRIATLLVRGKITLTPITAVPCEPDRVVRGPSLEIEVS